MGDKNNDWFLHLVGKLLVSIPIGILLYDMWYPYYWIAVVLSVMFIVGLALLTEPIPRKKKQE